MIKLNILPDCMMPDGADPCAGYHELQDNYDKLEGQLLAMHVTLNDQEAEVERLETMVRWARADSEALNIENKILRDKLAEVITNIKIDAITLEREVNTLLATAALDGDKRVK